VLQLASILWRLRRATTMETGLLEIQAEHLRGHQQSRQLIPDSAAVIHALLPGMKANGSAIEFAQCFLRLANLPNFALDRLSRYESSLLNQARRILFALDTLDRRKPQERANHFRYGEDPE
jgi:hypothetical protein